MLPTLGGGISGIGSAFLPARVAAIERGPGADVRKPAIEGRPWSSDARIKLAHDVDALLAAAPTLHGAHVGLLAIDTQSGAVLYERNADDAFVPASTMKLLTGSVALATLGTDYRFRTQAYLSAGNDELVVRTSGDPLLRAADLNLLSEAVHAAAVVALPAGVRIDVSAFEAAPYPPGWAWDDFAYDYSPALSAAVINENVVHLTVAPGLAVGQKAQVSGAAPFDTFANDTTTCSTTRAVDVVSLVTTTPSAGTRADPDAAIDITRAPGGCIVLTGSLPLGTPPIEIDAAVVNPVNYLRQLVQYALHGARVDTGAVPIGIPTGAGPTGAVPTRAFPTGAFPTGAVPTKAVTIGAVPAEAVSTGAIPTGAIPTGAVPTRAGPTRAGPTGAIPTGAVTADVVAAPADGGIERVPPNARLIWTHDGEPLTDLIGDMWLPSDNLIAEQLLKAIGLKAAGVPGTIAHGADAERAWLTSIGVNPVTLTIADGSGLSAYDRLTPRALVAILQADWHAPYRAAVLDDLPIAGVRGTLKDSFLGTLAERRTFAKTGTVNHARGLAGYLATLHHGAVTLVWSVDDWLGASNDLAELRGRVLARIIGD